MRFITADEARAWLSRLPALDASGLPLVPAPGHATLKVPFEHEPAQRIFVLAQDLVDALGHFDECLLWVTQTGVWPSNENLHLYYRLRSSYADVHLVDEKPAVRALRHEASDLVSLVHLGMLFGWDMLLLTSHDYGRVFVSHDGWFQLSEATPTVIPRLSGSAPAQ